MPVGATGVGDIIALANLVVKVTNVLREATGSSAEYQSLVSDLDMLQRILLHSDDMIRNSFVGEKHVATVNMIKSHANFCKVTVEELMVYTEGYRSKLRKGSTEGRMRQSWAKIGWSLFKSDYVKVVRGKLKNHMDAINTVLLMSSHAAITRIDHTIVQMTLNPESATDNVQFITNQTVVASVADVEVSKSDPPSKSPPFGPHSTEKLYDPFLPERGNHGVSLPQENEALRLDNDSITEYDTATDTTEYEQTDSGIGSPDKRVKMFGGRSRQDRNSSQPDSEDEGVVRLSNQKDTFSNVFGKWEDAYQNGDLSDSYSSPTGRARRSKRPQAKKKRPPPPPPPPLKFKDCLNRKYVIPWDSAKSWKKMSTLITTAFAHIATLDEHAAAGHYDLLGPDSQIILPSLWDALIQPHWEITMHMWPIPGYTDATAAEPPNHQQQEEEANDGDSELEAHNRLSKEYEGWASERLKGMAATEKLLDEHEVEVDAMETLKEVMRRAREIREDANRRADVNRRADAEEYSRALREEEELRA